MHGSGRALIATALIFAARIARADDPPAPDPQPPAPEQPPEQPPAPEQPAEQPIIKATGRVIDAKGRPIKGAIVKPETGSATATTDGKGRFTIEAPVGASLIITSEKFGAGLATVTGPTLDDTVLLQDAT